jgi:uncharacterized protein (TIGR03437 family)
MRRRTILFATALAAAVSPFAQAYLRSMVSYSDGTRVPLKRVDNAGIQVYLNTGIAPNLQSTAGGSPVIVFPAASDPAGAIRAAAASWNNIPSAKLKFLPIKTTENVADPTDNQMTVLVASKAADLSALGSALALTVPTLAPALANDDGSKGVIADSDILINPAYSFSTDGLGQNDLQAVMTHEFGHALGMNHSGLIGAVMFQAVGLNGRYLTADEIGFAISTYPGPGASLGTIAGKVLATDGSPVQSALVEILDITAGSALSCLTDATGAYSLQAKTGDYIVYAEPVASGSLVQPANLYLGDIKVTNNFQVTMLGGFAAPAHIAVSSGSTANVPNLTVTPGASTLSAPLVGIGRAGSTGDFSIASGAIPVSSGQTLDLELIGGGVDGTIGVQVFGKGINGKPGAVRADPTILPGILTGRPFVRFTLDTATVDAPSLITVIVTKGQNVFAISGAFVLVPPKPTFVTAAVDSAASALYLGAVSPGGISSIYDIPNVPNLGPALPVGNGGYDDYGSLPANLAGVSITFDGVPAPLFFVYGGQINLQVPFEVAGKTSTKVVVNYLGSVSAAVTVPVVSAQPAFFLINATDPFAANADYATNPKPNSVTNAAARGSVISVYGTGVGKVSYDIATGSPAPGPPGGFTGGYTCTLGGKSMTVPFAGWTPTSVGLAQWSFVIPTDSATGAVSLKCTDSISGASTQTATIYIK